MKVLMGSKAGKLGQEIASLLDLAMVRAQVSRFPDGESNVLIHHEDVVPGTEVLVLQSLCSDGDIMEFLFIVDALNRLGVRDITLVSPYFGYARADRIVTPGSSVAAKVVARLVGERISSLLVLDVHFPQFEGFFEIPVYNVLPWSLLKESMHVDHNMALVAPDVGAVKKLKPLSEELGTSLVIMNKRRPRACLSEVTEVVGEIYGKDCIIVDDIVCGGGTLCNSAAKLKELGAKSVVAFITHGVFSGSARQKITGSHVDRIVVTNSIPGGETQGKIEVISAADLLARKIRSVYLDVNTKSPNC
ncbi:ribose-phosphate diphosphokinase [Neorickettsia sp. 179522]|uniref:ribose-phosphate diphosphokinase n=1 Tax=Neorickettsia sp. 179522 TaxID=1714371 RepID=UPI0007925E5F|nr:ribose-phosphate diphosphokinase [Neorickettsia sp. 179522]KYH12770.1 ribose-phosphate pyrophosphokinase [Neorickettsia sp. 179522]